MTVMTKQTRRGKRPPITADQKGTLKWLAAQVDAGRATQKGIGLEVGICQSQAQKILSGSMRSDSLGVRAMVAFAKSWQGSSVTTTRDQLHRMVDQIAARSEAHAAALELILKGLLRLQAQHRTTIRNK